MLESKHKWAFIGESDSEFTKGHTYRTVDRHHTKWANMSEEEFRKEMNDAYPNYDALEDGYLIFIGDSGDEVLVDRSYWLVNFYKL
ncbi:hypothetical protein FP76_gp205 [Bacillus phage Evoli]|uniref:Uncharacterized protein n=2 Tax=Bastillevirus TaxID=1918010 RepID=A0A024AZU3_9CAUD|nr:hypothetical protein FP73_gp179 [Bacillus phage Hoody T]YP_009035686.1 hypothetical protein FP76_gp205 [Bacillus phage Evoli]AHZ09889.1 hypothetical protein [Bacillus phage Evoli]AHZ10474.1 hypothetical protein [Bacillus phage Hoody T]